mmetsp:Transcript_1093/g.1781  ORF Transcript_1093/g.1781 Transcript_1093/m.1781 type:complete len:648 (-) Transcript_1093:849-2792(-)
MSPTTPPSSPVAAAIESTQLAKDTSAGAADETDHYDSDEMDNPLPGTSVAPSQFDLVASLYKRRGGLGRNADVNWVARCFSLCGPVLCYYDSPDVDNFDPSKPRGRLNLAKEDTAAEMHTRHKKSGAPTEFLLTVNIYILGAKRKWGLCCNNKEEQIEWYNAIKRYDGKTAEIEKDHFSLRDFVVESQYPLIQKSKWLKKQKSPPITKSQLSPARTPNRSTDRSSSADGSVIFSEGESERLNSIPEEKSRNLIDLEVLASIVALNVAAYCMRYGNVHVYWISIIALNLIVVNLLRREASKYDAAVSSLPSQANTFSNLKSRGKYQNKTKGPVRIKYQAFQQVRPAGTTLQRANPKANSSVADIEKEHGPMSTQSIRAYCISPYDYDLSSENAYWNVDARNFNLRVGPNYKKNRLKEPSSPALYDLISVDFIRADTTLKKASDAFTVPNIPGITDIDTGHPHVPPMFVINAWIPLEDHGVFGKVTDAPSINCVMCLAIAEHTLKALKDIDNAPPAVKLFAEWCRIAETDDEFRARFKALGIVCDIEKTNIPSFIASYNGKPALVTKSGTFIRHEHYIEFCVNVHMWGFLARKGLVTLTPKFAEFVLDIGFTIEAKRDHELPEVLLGGMRLIHFDPEKVIGDKIESVRE